MTRQKRTTYLFLLALSLLLAEVKAPAQLRLLKQLNATVSQGSHSSTISSNISRAIQVSLLRKKAFDSLRNAVRRGEFSIYEKPEYHSMLTELHPKDRRLLLHDLEESGKPIPESLRTALNEGMISARLETLKTSIAKDTIASSLFRRTYDIDFAEAAELAFRSMDRSENTIRAYVGIDKGKYRIEIDQVLSTNSKRKTVTEVLVEQDVFPHIQNLAENQRRRFLVANLNGPPLPTRVFENERRTIEITPSLFLTDQDALPRVNFLKKMPFKKDDIEMIAFFDRVADLETTTALAKLPNTRNLSVVDLPAIRLLFESTKSRFVGVIGHVEGRFLVIRDVRGEAASRVLVEDIIDAGKKSNIEVIMLGCETSAFQGTAGFLGKVNSLEVIEQIRTALEKENGLEFFSSLGSKNHPIAFGSDFLNPSVIDMKIIRSRKVVTPGIRPELRLTRVVFSMKQESLNASASPQAPSRDQTPEPTPKLKGMRNEDLVAGGLVLIIGVLFFIFMRNWSGRS